MSGRVLVLGASGMLGHAVFRVFCERQTGDTFGALRSDNQRRHFQKELQRFLIVGVDVERPEDLLRAFEQAQPSLVINCVGVIKQLKSASDPLVAIPLNALLPHRLAALCAASSARLIHVSTDCVFSGERGNYVEADCPDARDLYGRSKLLGEVDCPHAVTLRTSIIGPELGGGANGLVGWFLSEKGSVKGYSGARFSGLPTVTLARIMRDVVEPDPTLRGLYHVGADPIDKLTLLRLLRDAYAKAIEIEPDANVVIDRSLDSTRFQAATGYKAPPWPELVDEMRLFG